MAIDALIFDLGGVVLNVDYHRGPAAFAALGCHPFAQLYSQGGQHELFDRFEVGAVSPEQFRDELRGLLHAPHLTDAQIDRAWNAMILDWPMERLQFLRELKRRMPTYLLSNTNAIHAAHFRHTLEYTFESGKGLEEYFSGVFLSHEIGKRKPHAETFQHVLQAGNHGDASKVLFMDDSAQHIAGAEAAGLRALLIEAPVTILDALEGLV